MQAAALSFSTVVSIVPLVAVAFGVMAWTTDMERVLDRVQQAVVDHLVPNIQLSSDDLRRIPLIQDDPDAYGPPLPPAMIEARRAEATRMTREVAEAQKAKQQAALSALRRIVSDQLGWFHRNSQSLSVFGALGALVVACILFHTIEGAVNRIWQVRHRRNLVWKVLVITALIVYVPLFLGVSLWLAAPLLRTGETYVPFAGVLLPLAGSVVFFALFNKLVPAAPVQWHAAIWGGLVSGLLFELAKWAFALYIGQGERFATLYGGLAILPILLFWVYYTWVITLLGTHAAFGVQFGLGGLESPVAAKLVPRHVAWGICAHVARAFRTGQATGGTLEIARALRLPPATVEDVLDQLVDAGVLAVSRGRRTTILPARSPGALTIADVMAAVESVPAAAGPAPAQWETRMRQALPTVTLEQLATD